MLQISGLTKSYGAQELFRDASFSINAGEKIGLVGRNGHGKTTLIRILSGEEDADDGLVHRPDHYRIGHLSQHLHFTQATAVEEGCLGLPTNAEGWQETYRVDAMMEGLGFSQEDCQKKPQELSGGFQIRLNLVKLLASEPNLLLLDEPTNYLDIVSMRWLARFLKSWPGELVLITHDRDFMDRVITHTLGVHRRRLRKVAGTTQKLYEQLLLEEEVHEQRRVNQEQQRKKTEDFIRRFRAKATKAKAVQSRIKALDRSEKLEALETIEELDFRFRHVAFPGKWLMHAKDVDFAYDANDSLLIEKLSVSIGKKDRIAIIGKNGRGKSTLLNVLARELKPIAGSVEHADNLELGYFGQTNIERLTPERTIEEELLATAPSLGRSAIRGICGLMMFEGDLALKKIKVLSGGEKSRVLLGKILLTSANLLFLDEPSNHLDMESTSALYDAIEEFPGAVVFVTHSEAMLRELATRLIILDGGKSSLFEGSYDDFLRRVGWQDEDQSVSREDNSSRQLSKKELRSLKAEVKRRRQEALAPLTKTVRAIESEISALEKTVAEETEQIIEASKDGYGEDAQKLSRSLHRNKEKVEDLYEKLEEKTRELEERQREFDEELKNVEQ